MVLNNVLNPILTPLLNLVGPFWTIFIVSLFVASLTTLVYKFTTDQEKLKGLKADLKRYQNKIKTHKDNPEKALKLQKDMMRINGEYMRHSLKSTLYTFLPIILFFGWMQANLAFAPITPDMVFNVTATFDDQTADMASLTYSNDLQLLSNNTMAVDANKAMWSLKGPVGMYTLSVVNNKTQEEQFFDVLITTDTDYVEPTHTYEDSSINTVVVSNKKLLVLQNVLLFKHIPWLNTFGWFGTYFMFSIIFSTSLRRALKLA